MTFNSDHALIDLVHDGSIQIKVWWIPQLPMKPFEVIVSSFTIAHVLLNTLANYDLFQFENRIKPDYSNMGGVQVFKDGQWEDFDGDGMYDFDDLTLAQCVELDRETREAHDCARRPTSSMP